MFGLGGANESLAVSVSLGWLTDHVSGLRHTRSPAAARRHRTKAAWLAVGFRVGVDPTLDHAPVVPQGVRDRWFFKRRSTGW